MAAAPQEGAAGEVRALAHSVDTGTTARPERFDRGQEGGGAATRRRRAATTCRRWNTRDMPEPLPLRKVLGPSVILAGVGVGSGEYILWPYISANAGIGFLYLAVVGVTIQYFLNMEIERYTLATGETAIAGFARSWKPWGSCSAVFAVVPNIWPGWGTAGATIFTYLVGGQPDRHRDDRAARDRGGVDHVARRLQGARAARSSSRSA